MESGSGQLAAPVSRGWRWGDWWGLAVRVVLLVALAAGAVSAAGSLRVSHRQEADLAADLAAGKVSYAEYDSATHQVRWVDGWWSWRQAVVDNREGQPAADSGPGATDADESWLYERVAGSPRSVSMQIRNDAGTPPGRWLDRITWGPLRWAATLAGWLTLLLMLSRRDHRYANRWAWFWLFVIGQAPGLLLYPLLEPWPLWRRPWRPGSPRVPIRGGAGFGWSLLLALAIGVAGAGVAAIP